MIVTRVEALGFRSLRYVSQRLGPFQVLVGPNASGKSTFLDVLAFLGDLQRAGLEQAVFGNAALGVPLRAVDPRHLTWMRRGAPFELAVEMRAPNGLGDGPEDEPARVCRYEIAVQVSEPLRIAAETLWLKQDGCAGSERDRTEFPNPPDPPERIVVEPGKRAPANWRRVFSRESDSERVLYRAETTRWSSRFRVPVQRAALASLPDDEDLFPAAARFRRALAAGVSRIAPWSDAMRRPGPPAGSDAYRPDGSNLPHVVQAVEQKSPARYADWLLHVREALPDVDRITVTTRPEDGHRYLVVHYRSGLQAPSWLVSEGTLRFLALTLLAYLPEPAGPYLIEEPENGIHPCNVETVFQSLSSVYDAQVLLATHSADVARLVPVDRLLCFGRDDARGVDVVAGPAHPRLRHWPAPIDLGALLAAGVLG